MTEYTRDNPSPRFQQLGDLYKQVHETGLDGGASADAVFGGRSLLDHVVTVEELARRTTSKSVLDYGCGKAKVYQQKDFSLPDGRTIPSVKEFWNVDSIRLYDPGVNEYSERPTTTFDGVVSTDVLEHIPEEDIDWVLAECFGYATNFVYMNIASYPAKKTLPNGWNAHVTVQSPDWWRERIRRAAARWRGRAYVFDVTEKRTGITRGLVRLLTGSRLKLTRIEMWR